VPAAKEEAVEAVVEEEVEVCTEPDPWVLLLLTPLKATPPMKPSHMDTREKRSIWKK
jgi:hypothetical protein